MLLALALVLALGLSPVGILSYNLSKQNPLEIQPFHPVQFNFHELGIGTLKGIKVESGLSVHFSVLAPLL